MSTKGNINLNMNNPRIAKFVNYLMKEGKKYLAMKLLSNAFARIKEKSQKNPEEVFEKAIDNVIPKIEVRPKRV